MYVAAKACTFL